MSTYLVAFVISDFTFTEVTTELAAGKKNIRLWSRKSTEDQRSYDLEIAKRSLNYFENMFGQEYPIPKMDLIALPAASSTSMENWGLLTFRESHLLINKEHTSTFDEQENSFRIVYEISNQWISNLVTFQSWSYHWLSEGFSIYLGLKAINKVNSCLLSEC